MNDIQRMQIAHNRENWQEVQELAHKIKGGAIYIGAVRLKMACQYLERYWKIGKREALELLYQQLIQIVDETHQSIRHWLQR